MSKDIPVFEKLRDICRVYADSAAYRWKVGSKLVVAHKYARLSGVRLETLSVKGNDIVFSLACGYLNYHVGAPEIVFSDSSMVTVQNGPRQGFNIPLSRVKSGENCAPTVLCGSWRITEDTWNAYKWLHGKIVSLVTAAHYNVVGVVEPLYFREYRSGNSLVPLVNQEVINLVGHTPGDDMDKFTEEFRDALPQVAEDCGGKWVVPFSLVSSGGGVVCATKGLTNGGVPHKMNIKMFNAECSRRHWQIATAGGNDAKCNLSDLTKVID